MKTLYRNNQPYLIRRTLISTPWFSLKLHKILLSDPNEPHDHPWNYISLILRGGYFEELTPKLDKFTDEMYRQHGFAFLDDRYYQTFTRWHRPGSLLFRKGDRLHKLILPEGKTCTTLVLTTKKWRKWGFLKQGSWEQHPIQ